MIIFEIEEKPEKIKKTHLFVGAEPKYSPSKVMQILKSITARQIFKEYPEIKKQL